MCIRYTLYLQGNKLLNFTIKHQWRKYNNNLPNKYTYKYMIIIDVASGVAFIILFQRHTSNIAIVYAVRVY